ncbi:MAG TPA: hypothetical protein VJZ76_03720 [Thermoanaerobaculia bacterium]|nr:hypothetical protein [Thermoanaerobaculia bacterium]
MRIAAALIAVLAAVAAEGVTIAPGDIAIGPDLFCGIAACPPLPPAALFGSNLALKQTLGFPTLSMDRYRERSDIEISLRRRRHRRFVAQLRAERRGLR